MQVSRKASAHSRCHQYDNPYATNRGRWDNPKGTLLTGWHADYLEAIVAQNAAFTDEVTAVNILVRRMANTVLLIQALGGGWDRSSLPARPECCDKLVGSNSN
jgi:hypothetical protein